MKVDVVPIDPYAFTYKQARELTELYTHAFASDPMHEALWGPEYKFMVNPPIGAANMRAYRAYLDVKAYAWLRTCANPAYRSFLARDADTGAVLGFVVWVPPAPVQRPASRWQRLWLWWWSYQSRFWNWWHFRGRHSPAKYAPEFIEFGGHLDEGLQFDFHDEAKNDAYRTELAHKMPAELADTPYLSDDTHFCMVIAVSPTVHRQGVGRALLQRSARELPLYEPEFRDGAVAVRAPQQYTLFASAQGSKLYEATGWTRGRTYRQALHGHDYVYPRFFFSGRI